MSLLEEEAYIDEWWMTNAWENTHSHWKMRRKPRLRIETPPAIIMVDVAV
jgi:hypothetical protein